jgi:uncharacterized metal-binding protein YceD (DUF177 family)
MKVHTNQIPAEGLHLEGEEDSAILGLADALFRPAGPVEYSLDIGLSGDGLFATGQIGVDVDTQCVTCLEAFRLPVRVPDFAAQVELEGREMVDLTDPVREDILLALPPHPHCDWNGEKECPGAFHREDDTASDPESEKPDVWNALDQLKLQ